MKPEIKSKIMTAILGAVGGAVVAMAIGFGLGGWTTAGTTQKMTDEALVASQAAICVAQFMKQPNSQEKLSELKKLGGSYSISVFIGKEGWDRMPGKEKVVNNTVARACADGLELLMEE